MAAETICHEKHYLIVIRSTSALALAALFKLSLTPIYVWSEAKLCCRNYLFHVEFIACVTGQHDMMVIIFLQRLTINRDVEGEALVRDPITHLPIKSS